MRFASEFYLAVKQAAEADNPYLATTAVWGGAGEPRICIEHRKRSRTVPHVSLLVLPRVQRHPTDGTQPGFRVEFRLEEKILTLEESQNLPKVMAPLLDLVARLEALYGKVQVRS